MNFALVIISKAIVLYLNHNAFCYNIIALEEYLILYFKIPKA